jgi:hypothetical protein
MLKSGLELDEEYLSNSWCLSNETRILDLTSFTDPSPLNYITEVTGSLFLPIKSRK